MLHGKRSFSYVHYADGLKKAEQDKMLIVLENSRHGAENNDVEVFQEAIKGFIERYR